MQIRERIDCTPTVLVCFFLLAAPPSESGFREEKPASAESDNRVSVGEKSSPNEVTVNNPDEFKHLVSRYHYFYRCVLSGTLAGFVYYFGN